MVRQHFGQLLQAQLDLQDLLAQQVLKVHRVARARLVVQDPLVLLVQMDKMELQVEEVDLEEVVLLEHQVKMVNQRMN